MVQLSQLEIRCWIESLQQTVGFGPSVTHGWATPAKMRKKCCYGQKNSGQYSSLFLSSTHLSHTRHITLSRIKCERYIFIKKCIRSFIEDRHYVWLCSTYICICMWLYNNCTAWFQKYLVHEDVKMILETSVR